MHLAVQLGYSVDSELPGPILPNIAAEFGLDANFVLSRLSPKLDSEIFRRRELSKDFRIAMLHLCLAELTGGPEGDTTTSILTDWLTGRNKAISAVKQYQIFTRINRTNARFLFESLLRWIRFAGCPGLLVVMDTGRISVARNPRDGRPFYTKAAVLDAYEVLRQLIDGTDRFHGSLVVVIPSHGFLDDDHLGRGVGAYQALKFRVFDEVRDRRLVNPMASLVRLSPPPAGGAV
jgi:hypothetical protein